MALNGSLYRRGKLAELKTELTVYKVMIVVGAAFLFAVVCLTFTVYRLQLDLLECEEVTRD